VNPSRLSALALAALGVAAALCPSAQAVVGGRPVSPSSNAAIVRLPGCTGALIAPDRVMTAAHCLWELVPGTTRLRIAGHRYTVARWARDPRYDYQVRAPQDRAPYAPAYDAGVVGLDRAVTGVAPLALRARAVAPDRAGRIIGFGTPFPGGGGFGTLRAAAVISRSHARCRAAVRRADPAQAALYKSATMLCVQDPDGRAPYRSDCNGDSGSPLLLRGPRGWEIAGIDAWGVACGARHNDPTVFMSIPSVLDFLTAPAPPWAPEPVGRPRIDGEPRVGQQLTCVAPDWAGTPPVSVSYHWIVPRSGADGATYTVRPRDAGGRILCSVEAGIQGGGSILFASPPVAVADH
jgi:Trypsin